MKLSTPQFQSLFSPELKSLAQLFAKNSFELRMAGGAVRDLLMGINPADVDFATDATPGQMKELFESEQIRMLHKKGEEHGTITCRINDKENFEITTLRIDFLCDGRRAKVEYTTDWKLDAFRRDLTVNSLFLGLDGTVYDFTGGLTDIEARRIAFVGDPATRIQEDYLRILRYFRFFGRLAVKGSEHDPQSIEAIIKYRAGLNSISGERIWAEFRKILTGRFTSDIIRCMLEQCKLGPHLALHSVENDLKTILSEFEYVTSSNSSSNDSVVGVEPSTALAALFTSNSEAMDFQKRCKCSNAERQIVEFIIDNRENAKLNKENLRYFKYLILDMVFKDGLEFMELSKSRCLELIKYVNGSSDMKKAILGWDVDQFPVNGVDLLKAGVQRGPIMKATLTHLFNIWKTGDLLMYKEQLLTHINDVEVESVVTVKQRKRNFSKSSNRS